ncbi:MAG: glycerophosphodiester phosphodiesterase [Bacteroidales bacterium]|nr:glycerophosphodiester phosphodiesterase [Bacteroidales bacterium]
MKKIFSVLFVAVLAVSCGTAVRAPRGGKVAVVAHRGFWNCEDGGYSENSIASLSAARKYGLWGSECDIHLTSDDVIIVNHDASIKGKSIHENTFADMSSCLLPNGEKRPSFREYLDCAARCRTTKLVVELKKQDNEEREDRLVELTLNMLREAGMFSPDRVAFISFSHHMCLRVAALAPGFINQYLSGDMEPEILHEEGINGIDYHMSVFRTHPDWVGRAHKLGMSVNVWTVNEEKDIRDMIELGVDAVTSNEPLLVRSILGRREYRLK